MKKKETHNCSYYQGWNINPSVIVSYRRMNLGIAIRLLHYDLEVMDSKYRNDLSTCSQGLLSRYQTPYRYHPITVLVPIGMV